MGNMSLLREVKVPVRPVARLESVVGGERYARLVETATRFGVQGLLGAQLRLGPGALFVEAGYRYAALQHRATGDAQLSTVTLALGFRVSF